jgi:hypothetical protein
MSIKARPFRTQVGDFEVEGFFEDESFVFRFPGLVTFRPIVTSVGEDERGKFAILQETEISLPAGFVLTVETNYDSDLQCEWGYLVTLKRIEATERDFLNSLLKLKGVDPSSVNLIIPPKQLISVYFDPHGVKDGSAQLHPVEPGDPMQGPEGDLAINRVQLAAERILFLLACGQLDVSVRSYDNHVRGAKSCWKWKSSRRICPIPMNGQTISE